MEISIDNLKDAIKWLVLICGGLSVIVPAIIVFALQKWSDWKNERWRFSTETKLKHLENKLSEKSSLLNNLIDAQKSNYNVSQEKRINSIDEIWCELGKLKESVPSIAEIIYNDVTDDEIAYLNGNDMPEYLQPLYRSLKEAEDLQGFFEASVHFNTKLFSVRPFIGEDVYLSLNVYNSFLGRKMVHLKDSIDENFFKHWKYDAVLVKMLKTFFPLQDISESLESELHVDHAICFLFEDKVLQEINDLLTGRIASNNSLEHIKMLQIAVADINQKINT